MHSISVLITKEKVEDIPFAQFNDVYVTHSDYQDKMPYDVEYVIAETDFFGGVGTQCASIFLDNGESHDYDGEGSINKALSILGVVMDNDKEFNDLFEWCGLDLFRSNDELEMEYDIPYPDDIYDEDDDIYEDDEDLYDYDEDDY